MIVEWEVHDRRRLCVYAERSSCLFVKTRRSFVGGHVLYPNFVWKNSVLWQIRSAAGLRHLLTAVLK
jgi:hypothetical protein